MINSLSSREKKWFYVELLISVTCLLFAGILLWEGAPIFFTTSGGEFGVVNAGAVSKEDNPIFFWITTLPFIIIGFFFLFRLILRIKK